MIKVLVVDDEIEVVESLLKILKSVCSEADIISTRISRQAKDILSTDFIDILLTDIKMPGVNGFELSKIAKECNSMCRVIFLTGYNDFDYAYQALKIGCDDFILKINTDEEIISSLKKSIDIVKKEKEQQELLIEAQTIRKIYKPQNTEELGRVEFVKKYIWENIDKYISLNQLAGMVYLNPAYLSRVFKNMTGQTITEYLNLVRIEKAQTLLIETDQKIQTVALAVGIDSPVYFGRMFKKLTGYTPQEYRNRYYGTN